MRTPRAKVLGSSGDDSIHISFENTDGGPEGIVGEEDLAVMNGLEITFFLRILVNQKSFVLGWK